MGSALLAAAVLLFCPTAQAQWATYRGDTARTGAPASVDQGIYTLAELQKLRVDAQWQLPPLIDQTAPPRSRGFWSSPVVHGDRLFIGGGSGVFYAFDRYTLKQLWQYPRAEETPLTSQFTCNPSSFGIASSAAIAQVHGRDAVIFGAPDRSMGAGLGDGRLFALDVETGEPIWKSGTLAPITGLSKLNEAMNDQELAKAFEETHQQIGYSAPLVANDKVYVGIANHCDNPIQAGSVKAVRLSDGSPEPNFSFEAASPRGGGIWSSLASDGTDIYATTGNIRGGLRPGDQILSNHALALLRLDGLTGSLRWKLQPVPVELDDDPDWAAGATITKSSCGTVALSTMKDGWTYAVRAEPSNQGDVDVAWQYPPTGFPFTSTDNWTEHGDTRFLRSGLSWNDTFVTMAGGLNINVKKISNYTRLHAFNLCSSPEQRLRWIFDVPRTTPGEPYSLGVPSGRGGFIFIGTRSGWLVVLADPSIEPPSGYRCEHPDVETPICTQFGFRLVPDPKVVTEVQLQGAISGEPVLTTDRVYVATTAGYLYALRAD
ncbi:PQQ-binding-like beta-propeller repeat protein [Mesorhizobium sp. M0644]